jgi:hypothetical protein
MLLGEKMKTYTRAYLYLLAGFILTAIANQLGFLDDPVPSYIAAAAFMIILYLNQWALGYRVRNNLYGTAPTEVREIIAYIGAHSDKSDFMDDGKSKRFAPHFEEKEARVRYFSGEVA